MPEPGIKYGTIDDIPWEPHPTLPGVKVKKIYTQADHIGITSFLACIEKGHRTDIHIHENSDDILYVLEGTGKFYIEDIGEIELAPGSYARAPKGIKHGIVEVGDQDLILLEVFHPEFF